MTFTYEKVALKRIKNKMIAHLYTYSTPIDSFIEDHILDSTHYSISADEELIGYFSIHGGKSIVQFHMDDQWKKYGRKVFREIVQFEGVQESKILSCDQFHYVNALELSKNMEFQGDIFRDSDKNKGNTLLNGFELKRAALEDMPLIKKESKDFFDKLESFINDGKIFIGRYNGEVVSFGIIEYGRIIKRNVSIGMFVVEKHRNKGFGSETIRHLRKFAYDNKFTPGAGCWHYNHNSRKTLENAGFITESYLINVKY